MRRVLLMTAAIGLGAGPAARAADPRDCMAIDAAAARLACYDDAFGHNAVKPPPSSGELAATAPGSRGFGAEMLQSRGQAPEPSQMRARIAGPFGGWEPRMRFTLDNGQVWQVIDEHSAYYRRQDNPEVTIEKGVFGAYFLSVAGLNARAKVRRVQ